MWETIQNWGGWDEVSHAGAWLVTLSLMLVGLAGCVIPVIPGHLLIMMGAVAHWLMLGQRSGVEWWTFVVLGCLLAASQIFEFVSGAAGAKWFGGTKWGALGAFFGGIVGMFFMPFGLILGPLLGAYVFELLFAKQESKPAMVSGVGSAVGTLVSIAVKIGVGVVMVAWFVVDALWVNR